MISSADTFFWMTRYVLGQRRQYIEFSFLLFVPPIKSVQPRPLSVKVLQEWARFVASVHWVSLLHHALIVGYRRVVNIEVAANPALRLKLCKSALFLLLINPRMVDILYNIVYIWILLYINKQTIFATDILWESCYKYDFDQ